MPQEEKNNTLNDLFLLVGRLEGKMDSFFGILTSHNEEFNKHDERISKLERAKAYLWGVAAAAGAIASFAVSIISGKH